MTDAAVYALMTAALTLSALAYSHVEAARTSYLRARRQFVR